MGGWVGRWWWWWWWGGGLRLFLWKSSKEEAATAPRTRDAIALHASPMKSGTCAYACVRARACVPAFVRMRKFVLCARACVRS